MTDKIENIDLNSDEFANTPKALRDWAEQVQSQNAELRKQVSTFQDAALGSVLTQAGFANPTRVRAAIVADKIDIADQAKVNEWIAANGNDFARTAGAPAIPEPEQELPDYSAQANAQHQMQNLQHAGQPSGGRNPLAAAQGEVTKNMTKDDVLEILRKHGV